MPRISRAEFDNVVQQLPSRIDPTILRLLFDEIDLDMTGFVTYSSMSHVLEVLAKEHIQHLREERRQLRKMAELKQERQHYNDIMRLDQEHYAKTGLSRVHSVQEREFLAAFRMDTNHDNYVAKAEVATPELPVGIRTTSQTKSTKAAG